jgi:hypothetical protein
MQTAQRFSLKSQHGISLIGLILSLGVIVLIAMLAMKVVPTVIEYTSIKKRSVLLKQVERLLMRFRMLLINRQKLVTLLQLRVRIW